MLDIDESVATSQVRSVTSDTRGSTRVHNTTSESECSPAATPWANTPLGAGSSGAQPTVGASAATPSPVAPIRRNPRRSTVPPAQLVDPDVAAKCTEGEQKVKVVRGQRATKYLACGWWQIRAEVVCSGWYCHPVSSLTSIPMRSAARSAATVA